jgi:hypothetical protein
MICLDFSRAHAHALKFWSAKSARHPSILRVNGRRPLHRRSPTTNILPRWATGLVIVSRSVIGQSKLRWDLLFIQSAYGLRSKSAVLARSSRRTARSSRAPEAD